MPLSVDAVHRHCGQSRVSGRNRIQLFLQLVDLLPGRADIKIVSWPGERNAGDLLLLY